MTLSILFAATLSIASTNDYVYTILTSTNGIEGVGMGAAVDYPMMRLEDVAFLDEAWRERESTARAAANGFGSSYTNVVASTNISSQVVQYLGGRRITAELDHTINLLTGTGSDGVLLAEDQVNRLHTADRADTIANSSTNRHFNFRDPFDPHFGYVSFVGRVGNDPIGLKTNFWYRYTNLKRGSLVQTKNSSKHESEWSYVSHFFRDGFHYIYDMDDGWVPVDDSNESRTPVPISPDRSLFSDQRSAYLSYGKYTRKGESAEAYDWQYNDIEFPSRHVRAYADFFHPTNQEYQVVYIAIDSAVTCTITIYPYGETNRTESIANHRVLLPLSTSSASVKDDRITFSFDADDIWRRAEVAVGDVITLKDMKVILSSKIGGPPDVGGYYGNWNLASVSTSVYIGSMILVLRVKWHARELENGE